MIKRKIWLVANHAVLERVTIFDPMLNICEKPNRCAMIICEKYVFTFCGMPSELSPVCANKH